MGSMTSSTSPVTATGPAIFDSFGAPLTPGTSVGLVLINKTPGFTFFAVLTLALGIGATSTIFSVVNTVLLSPLPYRDADRIVAVYEFSARDGVDGFPVSPANFLDWRRDAQSFASIAAR